jgi:hypothetical protein
VFEPIFSPSGKVTGRPRLITQPPVNYDADVIPSGSEGAARLMELLGLTEDELCLMLDLDPLALLSGQVEHRAEIPILLDMLDEASERAGPAVLRRWVQASGPNGRPIDALLRRDFAAFEVALDDLNARGFVLRGSGN